MMMVMPSEDSKELSSLSVDTSHVVHMLVDVTSSLSEENLLMTSTVSDDMGMEVNPSSSHNMVDMGSMSSMVVSSVIELLLTDWISCVLHTVKKIKNIEFPMNLTCDDGACGDGACDGDACDGDGCGVYGGVCGDDA